MLGKVSHTRLLVPLAALLLAGYGLLSRHEDSGFLAPASEKVALAERQVEEGVRYMDEASGEHIRLALDHAVWRDEGGRENVVALDPVATTETLKDRLEALSTMMGRPVFPVAYEEGVEKTLENRQVVTAEIRVRMPREEVGKFAVEHGLEVASLPVYAPDWVVFSASDSMTALEKIGVIRGAEFVEEADVLLARSYVPTGLPNDLLVGAQWHLQTSSGASAGTDINVVDVWKYDGSGGVRGEGVKIGVIDSGIETDHPDFVGNIDTEIDWDFISDDDDPSPSFSDEKHGTAVAGLAAARGNNGLGVSGVAPEATIVGQRLIVWGTTITEQKIADALSHRSDVIQIKNNSWGSTSDYYKLPPLVAAALADSASNGRDGKGTIFTFSAGNKGGLRQDANHSEFNSSIYTIVVAAINSLGEHAYYSASGANVLITAPSGAGANDPAGVLGITTTDVDAGYTNAFHGTSAACPIISGVIALMLEKNPDLGWRDVQEILIRSAHKVNPEEAGWNTNGAGLHFNHDYGAGLVDAAAAVEMAGSWVNLEPQQSIHSDTSGLDLPIPDGSAAGASVSFNLPASNLVTEHVSLKLDVSHSARGELEVLLISPSGTVSRLAAPRRDTKSNYSGYTFSTIHNWGENPSGTWTLRVADLSDETNTTGGTLNGAELTVYGAPFNPAPVVEISSPVADASFALGSGYEISVLASDLDRNGDPDPVSAVELYENDQLVATVTSAPFVFSLNPASPGSYTYFAKATDSEGKESNSPPVTVQVVGESYDFWISGFELEDVSPQGDPDGDQLPNLMEYALNTQPDSAEQTSPVRLETSEAEISLIFHRAKNRNDVELIAEWSTSLGAEGWQTDGITETVLEDAPEYQKIRASLPIVPMDPTRFIRLRATRLVAP